MVWMVFPRPISSARITLLLLQKEKDKNKKIISSHTRNKQYVQTVEASRPHDIPQQDMGFEPQMSFPSSAIKSPTSEVSKVTSNLSISRSEYSKSRFRLSTLSCILVFSSYLL